MSKCEHKMYEQECSDCDIEKHKIKTEMLMKKFLNNSVFIDDFNSDNFDFFTFSVSEITSLFEEYTKIINK